MLQYLTIENIAVAKQMEISFRGGFTVVTGRTGAGKSIVIDSLLLLCGAKNGRELIRTGEDRAQVSAIFSCAPDAAQALSRIGYPPDEDGVLEVSRTVNADGRSAARINRKAAPLSALREIAPLLLSVQTQSERNDFADKSGYPALLDAFADDGSERAEYGRLYGEILGLRKKIADQRQAMSQREMMLDILKFQKKEIDSAKLSAEDEEEKLIRLRTKLKSIEKVAKYTGIVVRALSDSEKGATAAYLLERAENALAQLSDTVEDADGMAARLQNYRYEILDIAERVRDALGDDADGDPTEKLTQIEARLAVIEKLERKYGPSIAEIKAKRAELAGMIADLEDGDFRIAQLEKELAAKETETAEAAEALRAKRTAAARRLTEEIAGSLRFLDMPKVRFRVALTPLWEKGAPVFRPDGCDDVDFLISVNAGEELGSLGKVSSGGELSRITLALKAALARENESATLIFDEIDTGVSGGTSERIGIMMKKLSENAQVIAVTHSPQIASIAPCHLLIEKDERDGRTESSVREISGDERTAEIARIIGGIDVTEKQTAAAKEMLAKNTDGQ
jgi:DNA repair protein RecN (Recombination protein N)